MTYSLTAEQAIAQRAYEVHMLIAASDNGEIANAYPTGTECTYNKSQALVIKLISVAYDISVSNAKVIFDGCIQSDENIHYMVHATFGIDDNGKCGNINYFD